MYYAVMGEDTPDSLDKRAGARAAHVDRLQSLLQEGRLLLAGPFPAVDSADPGPNGYTGSLIIAEFDSLADAKTWADADPYVAAGVYKHVTIKPFKQTLP